MLPKTENKSYSGVKLVSIVNGENKFILSYGYMFLQLMIQGFVIHLFSQESLLAWYGDG